MRVTPEWLETVIRSRVKGFDALAVLPVPDPGATDGPASTEWLSAASSCAFSAMEKGFLPRSYGWTRENTARAYSLKDYGSWAKCVIVAAKYYHTGEHFPHDASFGRVARYTWRNNYKYLVLRLREAVEALEAALRRPVRSKTLSNYTSIPEKALFRLGGFADAGKNGVLIHPTMGSYFVVGEAFCDVGVDGVETAPRPTPLRFTPCGDCGRCRSACPTGAIVTDGVVNVNRCFQYMSENLVLVPAGDREKWGSRVYGCSECLDACPFNKRLEPWGEKHEIGFVGPGFDLLDLLELDETERSRRFQDNQIGIRDPRAVLKNVILSLGWLEYRKAAAPLVSFLTHPHHVIRASAVWALGRTGTAEGRLALERLARGEHNEVVIEEIERFL